MTALTFSESRSIWDDSFLRAYWKRCAPGDVASTYRFLNRAWDNYSTDCSGNILKMLSTVFGEYSEDFRLMKPFGSFREYKMATPEFYYDRWVEVLRSRPSGSASVFQVIYRYCLRVMKKYGLSTDLVTFTSALCAYLFRMSIGMSAEHAVFRRVQESLPSCRVVQARTEHEKLDIDVIIVTPGGKKIPVSVKCFNALSCHSVVKWSNKKPYPKIYIGFSRNRDIYSGQLTCRLPDGSITTLDELL